MISHNVTEMINRNEMMSCNGDDIMSWYNMLEMVSWCNVTERMWHNGNDIIT